MGFHDKDHRTGSYPKEQVSCYLRYQFEFYKTLSARMRSDQIWPGDIQVNVKLILKWFF